ncbi:3'-5' exonuclease [Lysinibacillus sp. 38-6]|uniref:3'-5' exonuclease n=1 Tax=Lysinibacillus sp. 38-6 TaxID=3385991 RepID=UPI0039089ECB
MNPIDEILTSFGEMQNRFLEEAIDDLPDSLESEAAATKFKASYIPNTWRYEEERLKCVVDYLRVNLTAEIQNSTNGRRNLYEEDDLSNFISDTMVETALRKSENPYFSRIDYIENGNKQGKTLYISNYDISYDTVSWKNPLTKLYYDKKFNQTYIINDQNVRLERISHIVIEKGQLIDLQYEQSNEENKDKIFIEKLAKKRGDEMKALVDTLQAEQYELIGLPINNKIVVQGSAGSGKSVIALHRLSYILYNNEHLDAKKVAIIGPNKLFLKHIEKVLPELGEKDIIQTTMMQYLEQLIPMRTRVREIDRMILSEINDLSIKEGRLSALEDFKSYSEMRKIKGSLEYKDYIEQYTRYIISNLTPFMKTISLGDFSISGVEIATFISNQPHYGDSKVDLNRFIENKIKERAHNITEIYGFIGEKIEEEVHYYLQSLLENELLKLSHPLIDSQLHQVHNLFENHKNIIENAALENYEEIFSRQELIKFDNIETSVQRNLKMKTAAHEKANKLKHQLNEESNKLKDALQKFIELKVVDMLTNIETLFTLRYETLQELSKISENYSEIFQKQFVMEEVTNLYQIKDYVSKQDIEAFIHDVNQNRLEEVYKGWLSKKKKLMGQLNRKMKDEIKRCFSVKLEQLIRENFAEVSKFGIKIKENTKLESYLKHNQTLDFTEIFEEIDKYYFGHADEVYQTIINDQYDYASKLEKKWDHNILKDYHVIEKHDLSAIYIIYKYITPKFNKPFQYTIVDEAQDYMLFDMYVLNDLTEQIMLMGDIGQNLTPGNEQISWQQYKEVIGEFNYYELKATYRSTNQIVAYSNEIIQKFSEGKYNLPLITFRNGEPVQTRSYSGSSIYKNMYDLINQLLEKDDSESKIAIIAKTNREAEHLLEQLNHPQVKLQINSEYVNTRVIITTPVLAKGLEYDTVLIYRSSRFLKTDEHDTKLAYVAASRALHKLYVYS